MIVSLYSGLSDDDTALCVGYIFNTVQPYPWAGVYLRNHEPIISVPVPAMASSAVRMVVLKTFVGITLAETAAASECR